MILGKLEMTCSTNNVMLLMKITIRFLNVQINFLIVVHDKSHNPHNFWLKMLLKRKQGIVQINISHFCILIKISMEEHKQKNMILTEVLLRSPRPLYIAHEQKKC